MPSNLELRLSPEAEDDFQGIYQGTLRQWGPEQAFTYSERLYESLDKLATFPDIGRARDEIEPGLRSFPVREYVVYYYVAHEILYVKRIIHGRRNPEPKEFR